MGEPSPKPSFPLDQMVAAHPFREMFRLPPEEVLDFFRSRVGTALMAGLSELKRRELDGLMSRARTALHTDAVDKMYMTAGLEELCSKIISLPGEIESYVKKLKAAKENK